MWRLTPPRYTGAVKLHRIATWRLLAALLLALMLAGCGGDDDGGDECSLGTDFDCDLACQHLEELCNTCDEPPAEGCDDPGCVESCENVKGDPEAIPEEYRPLVLGELNCLDRNDTCDGFSDCLRACLGS